MPRLRAPERTSLHELEPFKGLGLADVRVPTQAAELAAAWAELSDQRFVGFDTESKPTFTKGEISDGPHVVQFATSSRAYIFQMRHADSEAVVCRLLTEASVIKVGFGIGQDQTQLQRRLGRRAQPLIDLDVFFRRRGYQHTIGIKSAVAIVFNQRFMKSKRVTTTNWAAQHLEPRQLLYAANDAWAALRVLQALGLTESEMPIWPEGVPPPEVGPDARHAPARRRRGVANDDS
jgi:ribonuclease D